MKKYFHAFIFTLMLIIFSTVSFAQTPKIITLKDGSTLKGTVIELKDGTYTLETSNLGQITISESEVLNISAAQAQSSGQNTQLKSQVEAMQGDILSDPELMTDIQNILADEEVQKMLSDPTLLNDVMTYDEEKIQQNDSIQKLMKNPQMQDLMNKIQQKTSSQE